MIIWNKVSKEIVVLTFLAENSQLLVNNNKKLDKNSFYVFYDSREYFIYLRHLKHAES